LLPIASVCLRRADTAILRAGGLWREGRVEMSEPVVILAASPAHGCCCCWNRRVVRDQARIEEAVVIAP
jgi:hypothetical protein